MPSLETAYSSRTTEICRKLSDWQNMVGKEKNRSTLRLPSKEIFEKDYAAMQRADLVVAVNRLGSDCCVEIGFFSAKKTPIYYVHNNDKTYLNSPMLIPFLKNQIHDPDKAGELVLKEEKERLLKERSK